MVTYTTKVLIPLKLLIKRVLVFYRLPVVVPYAWLAIQEFKEVLGVNEFLNA